MADKDLTVHLKADDKITPAAKKAKSSLDSIPDRVETTVDVEAPGLDKLMGKLGDLPGILGQLGGAGAAGGVAALATGLFAAANSAKDLALEAQTTADLTGASVEEASKLQSVWKNTGADVNDLNDVLLQMNGALAQSPELAAQLGINLNDGKDISARFVELTDKLAAGQLTAVQASQLFGEEGVRQVGKLRTVYGGLSDDLEAMPAPISDEDVENAVEMERAMNRLKTAVTATIGEFGQRLVPLFADLAELADKATAVLPGDADAKQVSSFYWDWLGGIGAASKGLDFLNDITGDTTKEWEAADFAGGEFGDTVDDVTKATGRYTAAGQKARDALVAQVDATFAAQNALRDYSATLAGVDFGAANLEGGIAGMTAFSDQFFGLARIASDTEAAYDNLAASVKENGKTFDLTTEAGRANQTALEGVAATLDTQLAAAYDDADGDMGTFKKNAEVISLTTLARLADELGLNAEETQELGRQLGLMPEDIETRYNLAGVEEAKLKLDLLSGSIEALPKDVQAKVTQQIIAGDYQGALDTVNNYYANNPARLPVQPYLTGINPTYNPGLGVIGGGPRMVTPAAGPTATTTATGTTAVAPMAATPIYVNMPRLPVPTITVNTGVLGNRFDVDRTITRALRRHQRLNGVRP